MKHTPPKRRVPLAITGRKRRCCIVSDDEAHCGGSPEQHIRSMRPIGVELEEGVTGSGRRALRKLPSQWFVWKQSLRDARSRESRAKPLANPENHPASSNLHDVATWVVRDGLAPAQQASLKDNTSNRTLKLFTFCSGSDGPVIVANTLAAVTRSLASPTNGLTFAHVASCESERMKQRWITRNFEVPRLYTDITQLGQKLAFCYKADALVPVEDCDIVVVGASCKSLSSQNRESQAFRLALAMGSLDDAGCTGLTLKGMFSYLDSHPEVKLIIIENVMNLLTNTASGRPIFTILRMLASRGFSSSFRALCGSDYFLPQRRKRVYIWGVRGSVDHIGISSSLQGMRRSRRFSHSELFVADPSLAVMGSGARAKKSRNNTRSKWVLRHEEFKRVLNMNVDDPLPRVAGAAPPRVTECVALRLERLRRQGASLDDATIYVDGGQNVDRAACGDHISPCITPNNYLYLHSPEYKGFLSGAQALAYQGLGVENFRAWREFDDAFLRDLAGNAFSSHVFLCVLASLLAHFRG